MQHRPAVRALAVTAIVVLTVLPLSSPAAASAGCDTGSQITINSNPGAEAPSQAWGHRHLTGNHYVKQITSTGIIWWADNNGGSDGDTADTYYATWYCNH